MRLTIGGQERLTVLTEGEGGLWTGQRRREAFISQALTALHLMQRDTHYLVNDGKVQIIDEFTGRLMSDRAWEHGLHQLIETKEGCADRRPCALARIRYQRLFASLPPPRRHDRYGAGSAWGTVVSLPSAGRDAADAPAPPAAAPGDTRLCHDGREVDLVAISRVHARGRQS